MCKGEPFNYQMQTENNIRAEEGERVRTNKELINQSINFTRQYILIDLIPGLTVTKFTYNPTR